MRLARWLRYTGGVEDDPELIQKKLTELNASSPKGRWFAADGLHAVTRFERKGASPMFIPGSGIPLKVFFNDTTGEVKTFLARNFKSNGSK